MQQDTYRRTIVLTLVLGLAFLCVALVNSFRGGDGLLALLRGQITPPPPEVEEIDEGAFTERKDPLMKDSEVNSLKSLNDEVALLTKRVMPSVVSIHAKIDDPNRRMGAGGQGSGAIWTKQGHVVTNYHVVKGNRQLMVRLHDGTMKNARLIGKDPQLDIALLQIEGGGEYEALPFGDSEKVLPGHTVFAFGSPVNLAGSVTQGTISAKNRTLSETQHDLFQHSAPMNPGNSGGPLVNIYGQVVGINSAIYSSDKSNPGFQGIGFTIPSNDVYESLAAMRDNKPIIMGYMGLVPRPLSPNPEFNNGYEKDKGALVHMVISGTPAHDAGFKEGDILTHYSQKLVSNDEHFIQLVKRTRAGTTVTIGVWRNGKEIDLEATVGEWSSKVSAQLRMKLFRNDARRRRVGVNVEPLGNYERLSGRKGVKVHSVLPGSLADGLLQSGDYIQSVNEMNIHGMSHFYGLMNRELVKKDAVLGVWREGVGDLSLSFPSLRPQNEPEQP